MIRSGDYFMFEEDSDDEVDSSIGADIYLTESMDTDKKPGPLEVRTMTMTRLIVDNSCEKLSYSHVKYVQITRTANSTTFMSVTHY